MPKYLRVLCVVLFAFIAPIICAEHVRVCNQLDLPDNLVTGPFEKDLNNLVSSWFPNHSANDVVVSYGESAHLEGKFGYGSAGKDLEREFVELWLDECGVALKYLGKAKTDHNGRAKFNIGPNAFGPGVYQVFHRVIGDGTLTKSKISVFPQATKLAVFDIDGTLTIGDGEIITYMLNKAYVPEVRANAASITNILYDADYEIVYLTGRIYWFMETTRDWLQEQGFAPGTIVLSQSKWDSLPTTSGVGAYKARYLQQYLNSGFQINYAYGNAATDIYAYEKAGLSKSSTYILGGNGGKKNTVALGQDFTIHLQKVLNLEI